jgi:hypothetical protein
MALLGTLQLEAQKRLTEATISYDIVINTNNANPQAADLLDGATSVVYLKGTNTRAEMISSLGTQTTIINGKTGNVTILKDFPLRSSTFIWKPRKNGNIMRGTLVWNLNMDMFRGAGRRISTVRYSAGFR